MAFIEERLTNRILLGASFSTRYAVGENKTAGGNSYRRLRHPYPMVEYNIALADIPANVLTRLFDLYHKSGGQFGGFRVRHHMDYSTNNYRDTPTAFDQHMVALGSGVYQITRWYDDATVATSTRRRILKPVAGTVLCGVINPDTGNSAYGSDQLTIDTTTGQVTIASNVKTITDITQAAQAVVTVGGSHGYTAGMSVYFSAVTGMVEINGLRGNVVTAGASTITVDIDTSGFTAYSADGSVSTRPQAGETATAGCYFDLPVHFATALNASIPDPAMLEGSVTLEELLNI